METNTKSEKNNPSTAVDTKKDKKRKSKSHKVVKSASNNVATKADTKTAIHPKTSNRDYNSQLIEYLDGWTNRDSGNNWKFNKKLQTWALLNIYSLDDYTFLKLMPYILSIEGNSKDRLLETVIETIKDETLNKDDMKVTRAKQIKKLLVS
jgi:hypothetical protein